MCLSSADFNILKHTQKDAQKYKIMAVYDDKRITLKTVNDLDQAREARSYFMKAFSSSWTIEIEPSLGGL